MAGIVLSGVSKHYGAVEVIRDVSLDIEPGELIVFLGPSGSGKTTLLRMIAGLESIDRGTLTIDGVRSENLAPGKRNVAMVYQRFVNYEAMTAYENIAAPLRGAGVQRDEIDARVGRAADLLHQLKCGPIKKCKSLVILHVAVNRIAVKDGGGVDQKGRRTVSLAVEDLSVKNATLPRDR